MLQFWISQVMLMEDHFEQALTYATHAYLCKMMCWCNVNKLRTFRHYLVDCVYTCELT